MIDSFLINKGFVNSKIRFSVKVIISTCIVVMAVALPQIAHLVLGGNTGIKWLPMYLPVLLGGCLLGVRYGVCIGMCSPVVSFILTSIAQNPMPSLARLPFMIGELAIFGIVSGAFSKMIVKRSYMAFVAVLLAEIIGRGVFLFSVYLFNSITSLTPSLVVSQMKIGLPGLVLSLIIVPTLVISLKHFGAKSNND